MSRTTRFGALRPFPRGEGGSRQADGRGTAKCRVPEEVLKESKPKHFCPHSYDSPRAGFAGCSHARAYGRSLQSMIGCEEPIIDNFSPGEAAGAAAPLRAVSEAD